MMKKKRTNVIKSILMVMTMVLTLSATISIPAYAASKPKVTVKVKSPKKNVKLSGTKLTLHTKSNVTLMVKTSVTKTKKKKVKDSVRISVNEQNGQIKFSPVYETIKKTVTKDITTKATYKSSNKKVVTVNKKGKLTAKKNGTATLTVKYKGTTKKLKVTVSKTHNWKAHKKTKEIERYYIRCNCGVRFYEDNACKVCEYRPINGRAPDVDDICKKGQGNCICKPKQSCSNHKEHSIIHILKNEAENYASDYEYVKVKYTDYYYCDCGTRKSGEKEPKTADDAVKAGLLKPLVTTGTSEPKKW